jgi:hypothetical protein
MRVLLAVALSFAVLAPAQAGDKQKDKKPASSVPVKGTAENGQDVKKDVATLTTKITWQTSLETAKDLARKQGKMVFWMHMLGDLTGAT